MKNLVNLWFLTSEEKKHFYTYKKHRHSLNKNSILVQCPTSILYLESIIKTLNNSNESYRVNGVFPNFSHYNLRTIVFVLPYFLYELHRYLIRRKWKLIYRKNQFQKFYYPKTTNIFLRIKFFIRSITIYRKINSKHDLLQLEFDGIKFGDLIYDSYLRFNEKPTLNINDLSLLFYIYDCVSQINFYNNLCLKLAPKLYISTYSTYIAHGVAVRVLLNKGVKVFTVGFEHEIQYKFPLKELSISDFTQGKPHWDYSQIFKGLKDPSLVNLGLKEFSNRFKGVKDLDYMKVSPYKKNNIKFNEKLDGVVFLGDFFDSQHIYRSFIFNDLYEWLLFTIELCIEHKLNIGFKPHPNQLSESRDLISQVRNKYPSLIWIDENTNNLEIFKGIKFGVSVWGTVLPELAYHNIIPISCGDNPSSDYAIAFQAKNKLQYQEFLLNAKKLKLPTNIKNIIGEYYYMNNIHNFKYSLS